MLDGYRHVDCRAAAPRGQPGMTVDCHNCGQFSVQLDRSDCQGRFRQSTLATADSNCQK